MGQKQSTTATGGDEGISNTKKQQVGNNKSTVVDKNIAADVESRSNPFEDITAASHNFGQPLRPPHSSSSSSLSSSSSSTSSMSLKQDKSGSASKLFTDCRAEQRRSLSCIEENYDNKQYACAEYFEAYKTCRRKEHERKLEANAKASAW